jgi:uncharacterized protein (TIGR02246 family)
MYITKHFFTKNIFMKKITKSATLIIISAFLLLACNDSDKSEPDQNVSPAFDLAAAKTSIEAANAEFAAKISQGDSVGLANLYTTDGKLMGPNMPVATGRSNIQSAFGGMFNAMGKLGIKLTTNEVWGNETAVTEDGFFSMTDKDGKEIDKGKYLVVWKMEDGKWKLHRDCWNSDLSPVPVK